MIGRKVSNFGSGHSRRASRRARVVRQARACACERLEGRTLLSVLTISGTSGNDYISLAGSGGALLQVDVNAVITHYNPFDYTSIEIDGVGGNDTINILSTELPTTVVGAGQDTVMVGDTNGVQDITSPVDITDPPTGDYADLTVDDSADAVGRSATISAGSITSLAPAAISYSPQDLRSLTVNGGVGGNTFTVTNTPRGLGTTPTNLNSGTGSDQVNIQGTAAGTVLNLQGQDNDDTVSITNAGSVQSILGAVNIENDLSFDALTIDDSADTTARTATFSTFTPGSDTAWESLTGLAPASIDYEGEDMNSVTIDGGSGGNTFNVFGVAAGFYPTSLNTGLGADQVNIFTTGAGTILNVQGQNGFDTVSVTNGGSVQGILGTVNIENTSAFDLLTIDDSADATPRTATLDTFTPVGDTAFESLTGLAPGTINYELADIDVATIKGGTGGNTFNVNGIGAGGDINLDTGTGVDQVNILATAGGTVLSLQGQSGHDNVNLSSAGSVQGILGTINIENDSSFDTLTIDDSADATGRTATLSTFTPAGDTIWGSVTGLAPGTINYEAADVANPITIDGGTGGNTFNVNDVIGITNLNSGAGSDHINVLGTSQFTVLNLEGDGGQDTVNIGNAGSVQGILGTINIRNTPAFDTVTVDDSADATPRTATLSTFTPVSDSIFESLTGLAPGTINWRVADITSATINLGSGGNTFNINGTAAGGGNAITLNTGTGPNLINVNATASATILTINGQGSSDTINLDFTSGNPLPHLVNLSGLFTITGLIVGRNLNGTTLNLNRSTVFINYGSPISDPLALIQSYLKTGYNNGAWTGTATVSTGAINSAPAAANPNHNTAIGYADWADGLGVNTTPNTIELKYTLIGDANLSGNVNSADLQALLSRFNLSGAWDQGDFNYSGNVNSADLQALLSTFNTNLGNQVAAATTSGQPQGTMTGAGVSDSFKPSIDPSGQAGATQRTDRRGNRHH